MKYKEGEIIESANCEYVVLYQDRHTKRYCLNNTKTHNKDWFHEHEIDALKRGKTMVQMATKFDQSKIPLELLSPVALNMIGEVMAFGAKKYAAHNWRKGMAWSRLIGAALRHLFAYLGGEDKDPESGLSHIAHAGCCVMFLLEYIAKDLGEDDRYKEQREGSND